jgi:pimeloyl-ACP methyl ester carboxylesterase
MMGSMGGCRRKYVIQLGTLWLPRYIEPRRLLHEIALLACLTSYVHAQQAPQNNQELVSSRLLALAEANPRLELERIEHEKSQSVFVQGYFSVPENRDLEEGRSVRIGMVVLPARSEDPAPDPVFILHGGPGAAATKMFRRQVNNWIRQRRDVVLIDQRGTGSSNRLQVQMPGGDDDLQGYFESMFQPKIYQAELPRLQRRADLRQYTTANSVDDFDEIRAALGYEKINLRGGSYGTRSALVYMRRHPDTIRSASLQGIQPISYRNPLPHARSAQNSLDLIFEEIQTLPRYAEAFPDVEAKFRSTLSRLEDEPAHVPVLHPVTGQEQMIVLDRNAFAEAVRLQLYSMGSSRRLPLMLMRAHSGDYSELAQAALRQNRSVRGNIAWGMLMCVTGSEDISRIDSTEIAEACAGTFLGETRIRSQMAVAAIWPSGSVPESFGNPVSVDVPVLLFSGTHDPSTAPEWGADAARHLPNSLHVVVPSGHGVSGPEVERLDQAFLERGSVERLDLSEVEGLTLPPLVLPETTKDD